MFNCLQEFRDGRLTFAFEDTIDRATAMLKQLCRNKRRAVAADQYKTPGKRVFRQSCEIDNLGHICQIVAGKGYDIRPPFLEEGEIIAMMFNLQINEAYVVPGIADGLGHKLQAKGLQSKINFCIHERAWVDRQYFHAVLLVFHGPVFLPHGKHT